MDCSKQSYFAITKITERMNIQLYSTNLKIKEKDALIKELKTNLQNQVQKLKNNAFTITQNQSYLNVDSEKLKQQNIKLNQIEIELKQKIKELKQQQEENEKQQKLIEQQKKELNERKQIILQLENQLKQAQQSIEQKQKLIFESQTDQLNLKGQISLLQDQIRQYDGQILKLEKFCDDDQNKKQIIELQLQILGLNSQIDNLQREQENKVQIIEGQKQELITLEQSKQLLLQQIQQNQNEMPYKEKINQQHDQIKQYQIKVNQLTLENERLLNSTIIEEGLKGKDQFLYIYYVCQKHPMNQTRQNHPFTHFQCKKKAKLTFSGMISCEGKCPKYEIQDAAFVCPDRIVYNKSLLAFQIQGFEIIQTQADFLSLVQNGLKLSNLCLEEKKKIKADFQALKLFRK